MAVRKRVPGPGLECVCARCEKEFPHGKGPPCREQRCPDCGTPLLRKGSQHHQRLLAKREKSGAAG
jgi:rRNA maturation endonuclease Nob1